jgi:hypothetical protein
MKGQVHTSAAWPAELTAQQRFGPKRSTILPIG